MSANVSEIKTWARIPHSADDAAITLAYNAVLVELEARTGWCYESVQRTQFVGREPNEDTTRPPYLTYYVPPNVRYIRLERQPATAVSALDANAATVTISLIEINGIQYGKVATGLSYPLTLTVTAGTGILDPLLKLALYQRITQLVQSRGDDTVPLSADYWDNITRMMGKGIG